MDATGKVEPLPNTTDGKLERAGQHKEEGNNFFKTGQYKKAISAYSKAIAYTHGMPGSRRSRGEADVVKQFGGDKLEPISDEQEDLCKNIERLCRQNIAACNLKLAASSSTKEALEKFARNALTSCNKALEIDDKSWKALLRKGEAYVLMNSPDEAKACFVKALSLCGDDASAKTSINKEMVKVEKLYKKFEVKEKKMAAAMFGGSNILDDGAARNDSLSSSKK